MYHDLVCEHRKLSNEHSQLRLDLSKKGKPSQHNLIYRITFIFYSSCRHITPCRHISATAEEQVTELVKRVKELTGMPDSVIFQLITLHFKSFCFYHCPLPSNPFLFFYLQILVDEKTALEARHRDCVSSVDVAKQLDERDAGYKAELDQLKGQIAELLDEKGQREGQLKKV
jgi:hypothetical protein